MTRPEPLRLSAGASRHASDPQPVGKPTRGLDRITYPEETRSCTQYCTMHCLSAP
jgi:hypothetical protein